MVKQLTRQAFSRSTASRFSLALESGMSNLRLVSAIAVNGIPGHSLPLSPLQAIPHGASASAAERSELV